MPCFRSGALFEMPIMPHSDATQSQHDKTPVDEKKHHQKKTSQRQSSNATRSLRANHSGFTGLVTAMACASCACVSRMLGPWHDRCEGIAKPTFLVANKKCHSEGPRTKLRYSIPHSTSNPPPDPPPTVQATPASR